MLSQDFPLSRSSYLLAPSILHGCLLFLVVLLLRFSPTITANRKAGDRGDKSVARSPFESLMFLLFLVGGSSRMSKERAGSSSSSTTKQTRLQNTEKHNSCRVSHSCCSLTHSLTHSLTLSLSLSVSLSLCLSLSGLARLNQV